MPVPVNQPHHPLFRMAIVLLGVLAAAGVIGLLAEVLGADAASNRGTGTLIVAGVHYDFTPTTCFISDEEFAAAGTGYDSGQRYWISASSVNLDFSVGTESAIDRPDDDQLWLISDKLIDWQASGQTVIARASMSDRRVPESSPVVGSLEVHCDREINA